MKDKVCQFIENYKRISFHKNTREKIELAFTNGNCYWFAFILSSVFNGTICYLPIEGHFICRIEDEYYDIYGYIDESSNYRMDTIYDWEEYQKIEPKISEKIKAQCIYYTDI